MLGEIRKKMSFKYITIKKPLAGKGRNGFRK